MARTNINDRRIKPRTSELLTLHVLRREQVSPSFVRVTVGGGDIADFEPLGYDQWFRLFLPVGEDSLRHVPDKLTTMSYLRFLTVSKGKRPLLRNYTVRAFRDAGPDGPELDIDFVVHVDADGASGPAVTWARTCAVGDAIGIIDEGRTFNPPEDTRHLVLVADETGVPAVAGILASLPPDAVGRAVLEVPTASDRLALTGPAGVEVDWVAREDPHAVPGVAALAAASALPVDPDGFHGWVVGEASLPTGLRRHWLAQGVTKEQVTFCGYWKAGRQH